MTKENAKGFWEKHKGKIITGFVVIGLTTAAAIIGCRKGFKLGTVGDWMPTEFADTKSFMLMANGNPYWTIADFGKYGEQIMDMYKDFGFSKESIVKSGKLYIKTK